MSRVLTETMNDVLSRVLSPKHVDKSECQQEGSHEKAAPEVLLIPIEDAEEPTCT